MLARTELRSARKGLGLTQGELAGRIGMDRTRYNKIERGHLTPDVNDAISIAKAVKKRVEQVFVIDNVN